MKIVPLSERPDAVPALARWYFREWGYLQPGALESDIEARLRPYCTGKNLPIAIIAVDGTDIIGAAQLKVREVKQLPHYEHWLGGVYVDKPYRGRAVASMLVQHVIELAADHQIKTLYLQTEKLNGGLYARLHWKPLETIRIDGIDRLIMRKPLHTSKLPQ